MACNEVSLTYPSSEIWPLHSCSAVLFIQSFVIAVNSVFTAWLNMKGLSYFGRDVMFTKWMEARLIFMKVLLIMYQGALKCFWVFV